MKLLLTTFSAAHAVIAAMFAAASLTLVAVAAVFGWNAMTAGFTRDSAQQVIEALGLLAAAVVALQIAQTIVEEEVIRFAHVSGPTRVRRFLSRFLVVIVVALGIESLVATFRAASEDPSHLRDAAAMVFALGALLAGWGVFIRMNRAAEELEPEAMQEAKREDRKLR
jgi:hypothetical protein